MSEENGNGKNGKSAASFLPYMAAGVAIVVSIGGYFAEQGANNETISNMRGEIASLKEQVRHGDVHVQELNSAFQRNSASTCEQFIKIETQFGTTETVINELRVDDLRSRSIVWYKMFNQPYPDMFYEIKIPHDLEKCL